MAILKLRGITGLRDALLELETALGPPDPPAAADVLLNVTVSVGGYAAADQVWIVDAAFDQFLVELAELERTRNASARLESAVAEDFEIRLFSTDRAGHMAAVGHIADTTLDGFGLRLDFGFTFEPDLLPPLVRDFASLR